METFLRSSFGNYLARLLEGVFTQRSRATFLLLALGWTWSLGRHTITTYLWRSGAVTVKHFSRFYYFLDETFYRRLDGLWTVVIRAAAKRVPADQPLIVQFDDTTRKKSGRHIAGAARFRNGAGSARQEYRTLFGLNFVLGTLRVPLGPLQRWWVSIPIGLRLSLKPAQARLLGQPVRSRSALARQILDQVCRVVGPERGVLSVQDGSYATREFLRQRLVNAQVVCRLPINSPLYAPPVPGPAGRRGRKPTTGMRLGTPQTLAQQRRGWCPHPSEPGAEVRSLEGIWHSVLPGVQLRVVIIRRPALKGQPHAQRQWLEAFFTTDLSLSQEQILSQARGRWAIEIEIRDANHSYGLGQDHCRRYERIVAINAFRLLMGAFQLLWFIQQLDTGSTLALQQYRPWYRHKAMPSIYDVMWACRESLYAAGIIPIIGLWQEMSEIQHLPRGASSLAA